MNGPALPSEVTEIESVVGDYVKGWYSGDVARMDRALHPELTKRTLEGEELRGVTKTRMMELTEDGGGDTPNTEFEVEVDDVSSTIASARVLSLEYLDYLHLAKTSDGWKIVNVLFRNRV